MFQENKTCQIFRKINISYPLFDFRKIWRALFPWNIRFKIRPFALLPTNSHKFTIAIAIKTNIGNYNNNSNFQCQCRYLRRVLTSSVQNQSKIRVGKQQQYKSLSVKPIHINPIISKISIFRCFPQSPNKSLSTTSTWNNIVT